MARVMLFNLKGSSDPDVSSVPPKKIGVFADQSMPLPYAESTPDSMNLTAMFMLGMGLSNSSTI